jgi:hypothetical protein
MNIIVHEVFDIGVPTDEPQQFVNDAFEPHLLGGKNRESIEVHVKLGLGTEDGKRIHASPIARPSAFVKDKLEQAEVLVVNVIGIGHNLFTRDIRVCGASTVDADFVTLSVFVLGGVYVGIGLKAMFTDFR